MPQLNSGDIVARRELVSVHGDWVGSTFALARMVGNGSERLFARQLGAAAVAVLTGAYFFRSQLERIRHCAPSASRRVQWRANSDGAAVKKLRYCF